MVFFSDPRGDTAAQQLEWAFAIVLAHLRGSKVDEATLREAMSIVQEWAERTASALLRRWHIRNFTIEAKDIVQQWFVLMCSKLFKRCESGRPVAAYAYTILRRCCTALVRREARNPLRQLNHEAYHETATWLDAIVETETLSALKEVVTQLPSMQRCAVELWLLHKESKQPLRFVSRKARQRFHNLMFNARRRLKQLLRAYFADAEEKASIEHIALR